MNKFQRFIIKRLILSGLLTIAAVSIIFLLLRFMPGTPFESIMLSDQAPPDAVERMRARYGLDDPIHIQYLKYVRSMLLLEFGFSIRTGRPVWGILIPKLRNSLILFLPAITFTAIVSSLLGMYAGWRRGSWFERSSVSLSTALRATPRFVTGVFLLMIFAYWLRWFPTFGMRSVTATPEGWYDTFVSVDFLHHAVLPFMTTAFYYSGDFLLLARNGVIERKGSAFLKLHKAKGLTETEQLMRAGRNSMLPLITYFAQRLGLLFTGNILIEVVFAWPGIGRQVVLSLEQSDYPTVQAAVFLMALAIILANLLADITYGYFDPTIEKGETA
ncbi:MAG: ABC transporter permease [Halobacteriales archaeon]|nr:ABC transporter permease [Halobacteriales archaeon]